MPERSPSSPSNSRSAGSRFNNELRYRDGAHPNQTQLTPDYVLEPVREALGGIALDPCTEPDNPTRAARFYCLPVDGAVQDWSAPSIFVNPPYGKAREPWVRRCVESGSLGRRVVLADPRGDGHPDLPGGALVG